MPNSSSKNLVLLPVICAILISTQALADQTSNEELRAQVAATERAFAKTMADRDHTAFVTFLSEETVFMADSVDRGKDAVAERWKIFFEGEVAPFSWEPESVEILDSGELALSTGPVYSADGKLTAYYTSIWRLEAPDSWKIIFDKGNKACP